MQRKGTEVREVVEAREVGAALAKSKTIASEDEKVLRMRYGVGVAKQEKLARHGEGNTELQDELLLMEMELLRAYRQHQKQLAQRAAPRPSREKEKIVRALRKKR
jgi:adenylosuccinate synthase